MFARIQESPVACTTQEVKITDHSGLIGLILHEPIMSYTMHNSCSFPSTNSSGSETTYIGG